jgi:hypothetical protein
MDLDTCWICMDILSWHYFKQYGRWLIGHLYRRIYIVYIGICFLSEKDTVKYMFGSDPRDHRYPKSRNDMLES